MFDVGAYASDNNQITYKDVDGRNPPFWLKRVRRGGSNNDLQYSSKLEMEKGFLRRELVVNNEDLLKRRQQIAMKKVAPNFTDDGEFVGGGRTLS